MVRQPTAHSHCLRKWGSLTQVSLRMSLQLRLTGPFCELIWLSNLAENQTGRGRADSYLPGRFVEQDQQRLWQASQLTKGRGQKEQGSELPLGSSELWAEFKSPVHQTAFCRCIFTILAKASIVLLSPQPMQAFFLPSLVSQTLLSQKTGCSSTARRTRTQ